MGRYGLIDKDHYSQGGDKEKGGGGEKKNPKAIMARHLVASNRPFSIT